MISGAADHHWPFIHRARIDLPHGFEYELAEMGSGSTKATGAIKLDLKDSYGQFAEINGG